MKAAIFGAIIGSLFLGLPGALLGAVAGVWLKQMLGMTLLKGRLNNIQSEYIHATFSVMGAVCKADGHITRDEIRVAERMFDQMHMTGEQRERAKQAFREGAAADFDLDATIAHVRQMCHGHRGLIQMFLQVQLAAVASDDQVHPAERSIIMQVARGLGLSNLEVRQLEAILSGVGGRFQWQQGNRQQYQQGGRSRAQVSSAQQLARAYAILGVEQTAGDAEIKKAYRRQMSKNHPDKLASRGLPESMRDMAVKKTQQISAAYEQIKQARGLA